MKSTKISTVLLAFLLSWPHLALAKFGTNGIATTAVAAQNDSAYSLALQPDGKLVAAGYGVNSGNTNFIAVVRYSTDGNTDTAFGNGGIVTTGYQGNEMARSVIITADNKVVIAGYTHGTKDSVLLARYTSSGVLDPNFNTTGIVTASLGSGDSSANCVVQQGNKLVVAGSGYYGGQQCVALARFNADGSLDPSFGSNGVTLTAFGGSAAVAKSLIIQQDTKLVVAGSAGNDFALARYNSDGKIDTAFGAMGITTTAITSQSASNCLLQQDNMLVAAGSCHDYTSTGSDFLLARYTSFGNLDSAFGSGGSVSTNFNYWDYVYQLLLQPDGKILAVGSAGSAPFYQYALTRYNSNGSLDATFGTGGKVATTIQAFDNAYSAVLQPDGKIVVAGDSGPPAATGKHFTLIRYYGNGTVDNFDPSATATVTNTSTPSVTFTPISATTPTLTPTVATPTPIVTVSPTATYTLVLDTEKRLQVWHSQINPARNEKARIRWYQADAAPVQIRIYNLLGDEIIVLENNRRFPADQVNEILWDGTNRRGAKVGSGIYLVYYTSGGHNAWIKVAVVK